MDSVLGDALDGLTVSDKDRAVFEAAVTLGGAKVKPIADEAGLSVPFVHEAAARLEEQGFLLVNSTIPKTIAPRPPSALKEDLIDRIHSLEAEMDAEMEPAAPRTTKMRRADEILDFLDEEIRMANKEVFLSLPAFLIPRLGGALETAYSKGVLVMLLATGTEDDLELLTNSMLIGRATVARASFGQLSLLATIDGEGTLLASPQRVFPGENFLDPIVLEDQNLDHFHSSFFLTNFWYFGEEIYTTDPMSLPASFNNSRHAIVQAELHDQIGNSLKATVTDPEKPGPVEGPIIDIRQRLLIPRTNIEPIETAMDIDTGDEIVTIDSYGSAETIRFEYIE